MCGVLALVGLVALVAALVWVWVAGSVICFVLFCFAPNHCPQPVGSHHRFLGPFVVCVLCGCCEGTWQIRTFEVTLAM